MPRKKQNPPPPQAPSTHRVLRTVPAAAFIGVTPRTLDDMAYHRRGPAFRKVGRLRVYLEADLIAWLDAQPRGGESVASS